MESIAAPLKRPGAVAGCAAASRRAPSEVDLRFGVSESDPDSARPPSRRRAQPQQDNCQPCRLAIVFNETENRFSVSHSPIHKLKVRRPTRVFPTPVPPQSSNSRILVVALDQWGRLILWFG